jgi:ferredoxin-NADP reductase
MHFDNTWLTATIAAMRDLTPSIRELILAPEGGATPYPTGSHLRVEVMVEGLPLLRHYSLVGEPRDEFWRVAVKQEKLGRGGSRAMWRLPLGGRLRVATPNSRFVLSHGVPEYLLVAGGIGITPIRGMASELQRRRAKFRLLYAGRSRPEMAYLNELQAEIGEHLEVHADDEGRRVDLAAAFATLHPDGEVYVCGPIGLLELARRLWQASGRAPAALVFETFGSSGHLAAEIFKVLIPRLGKVVTVPADVSMLNALETADIGVLSGCRRGECGLCALDVLAVEGTLDHRDVFFSKPQTPRTARCALACPVLWEPSPSNRLGEVTRRPDLHLSNRTGVQGGTGDGAMTDRA